MDSPEACFSWLPELKNYVGDSVYFKNCSKYADRYLWAFGDHVTCTLFEPVHVFATEGVFQVSLAATGSEVTDTVTRSIDITVRPAPTYRRIIHNKELVSVGRGGLFTQDLDVDGDGTSDYQFKIDSWSQLSGAGWSTGSITGIHGTFGVNAFTIPDTTFLSKKWQVLDGAYWGKKIAIIRTDTESCRRISDKDTVLVVDSIDRITPFGQEELLDTGPLWTTNELFFWNSRGYGMGLWEERSNADSVWLMTRGNKIDHCHDFPPDTSYIGIRYYNGNQIKSGWIRVLVKTGRILILDTGIME